MASRYARASDNITNLGAVALTVGQAAINFPLTNVYDGEAHTVFKSTGTSATIQVTFGGARTLQAIALVHHRFGTASGTVTVTSNAGFNGTFTIPANSLDGHSINPWLLTTGSAPASVWTIAMTVSSGVVALGNLLLIETLRSWHFGRDYPEIERHHAITNWTDYGVKRTYNLGVRQRGKRGQIIMTSEAARADMVALIRDLRGTQRGFLFIPDDRYNDVWFATFLNDPFELIRMTPYVTSIELEILEHQQGLAL